MGFGDDLSGLPVGAVLRYHPPYSWMQRAPVKTTLTAKRATYVVCGRLGNFRKLGGWSTKSGGGHVTPWTEADDLELRRYELKSRLLSLLEDLNRDNLKVNPEADLDKVEYVVGELRNILVEAR